MTEIREDKLVSALKSEVDGRLRSIIHYEFSASNSPGVVRSHELVYVRDDVVESYSEEEVVRVIRDLEMESLGTTIQESIYDHGELRCVLRFFEEGVEMHFLIDDGEGVAIAFDQGGLPNARNLVEECIEVGDLTEG